MKFFLTLFVFALVTTLVAEEYPKKVRPYVIVDGDTFVVAKTSTTYRLWGIDAPEHDQPWGSTATEALREMVHKRVVTLQEEHGKTYGRPVVRVTVRGEDVGLKMIRMGLAWYCPEFAPEKKDYAEAQKKAQQEKIGIWSTIKPISPYQWRKGRKYEIIDEE